MGRGALRQQSLERASRTRPRNHGSRRDIQPGAIHRCASAYRRRNGLNAEVMEVPMSPGSSERPSQAGSRKSAVGANVVKVRPGPNVVLTSFVVERPTVTKELSAVEGVLDIAWKFPRPASQVWRYLKDSNGWQN